MSERPLPRALDSLPEIRTRIGARRPVFFLDFDGTLAPIASPPEAARLPSATRAVLAALARRHLVCMVSGRGLNDLVSRVDLKGLYFAADHGYRIVGPRDAEIDLEVGPEDRRELESAAYELEARLRKVDGAIVETKDVSLSVHYRMVSAPDLPLVHEVVADVATSRSGLRLTSGKMVHEFRPDIDWGKGKAMMWLMRRLRLGKRGVCPICVGDDATDEDMFSAAKSLGLSVVVGDPRRITLADYSLRDPEETKLFLQTFVDGVEGTESPVV